MCTYILILILSIEGGNNYINIIKTFLTVFVINFVLTRMSGINLLSFNFVSSFFIANLLIVIAKYIPFYFDIGLGNWIGDVFFMRRWVEYD